IALFADTIIATFLPAGALSALYYADRLNQLPIGVIGIAIGTVLLPEMSRRLSANDVAGASAAQRRAFEFSLLFSVPFVAAFLTVPDVIMRAMFARGAFSNADAVAAAAPGSRRSPSLRRPVSCSPPHFGAPRDSPASILRKCTPSGTRPRCCC